MPKFGGRTRAISVGGAVLAGLAGVVGVVIFANPAGAWHSKLTGTAECDTSTGTFTVTYTGSSTNAGTVTVKSSSPSGPGITVSTPNPAHVPDNGSFTITQTGVPASAGTASLTSHVSWDQPSNENGDASSDDVPLNGTCAQPATATEPKFTNGTCDTPQPTYWIPDVKGVDYQVNGQTVTKGDHSAQAGSSIVVAAVAQTGYTLSGKDSWPFTFDSAPTGCAGPTAPKFTDVTCTSSAASYWIPTTAGITYYVNGKPATAGSHSVKAGTKLIIAAIADDGHALAGTTSWTFTVATAPTGCATNGIVPEFVDNTCTVSGTYTIPATTADYTVNDVSVAPGKHSATAGATVTIKAIAAAGHPLTGTTSWTHTFPTLPQCAPAAANNGSGPLANTGPEVPVGQASLIAGLLALVGGAMLYAGRRRPAVASGRHSAS
jgi:hypothetical protein